MKGNKQDLALWCRRKENSTQGYHSFLGRTCTGAMYGLRVNIALEGWCISSPRVSDIVCVIVLEVSRDEIAKRVDADRNRRAATAE